MGGAHASRRPRARPGPRSEAVNLLLLLQHLSLRALRTNRAATLYRPCVTALTLAALLFISSADVYAKGKQGRPGKSGSNKATAQVVRADVLKWILEHNEGLDANFLKTELPDKSIKLPNGETIPIYKLKQFLDVNFRLTFYVRKEKKGSDIVPVMETRMRKLMARPEFYRAVKSHRRQYRISPKGKVSSQKAYQHFRNVNRRLSVTAGKQFHAPVGGGGGIAAPSWAVWKRMNIFFHEACHCIGIGHKSGGLSGPIAGKMQKWNRKKLWSYQTIDVNALTIPRT